MGKWVAFVLTAAVIAASSRCIATSLQSFDRLYDAGRQAMAHHDFARAESAFKSLLQFVPDDPVLLQLLAESEVQSGEKTAALAVYARVVELGFGMALTGDPAFKGLRDESGYSTLEAEALRQARVIAPAQVAFVVPERNSIPEGIAWDYRTGRFFVSSTYLRKISVRERTGVFRDFTRTADHGMWQALGLKVDAKKRWLLVCSGSDDPQMIGFRRQDLGQSGIFIYNLDTGRFVARYMLSEPGIHLFNDLVEGPEGKVYVTDSDAGAVYALDLASGKFIRMAPGSSLLYPNGIAISPERHVLYVADARGIELLDIASSVIHPLPHPPNVTTVGIDGLYFYRRHLIGTQTDVNPNRVMAYHLTPSLDRIDAAKVLEQADPRASSPTEGTIAGDSLYFIANSQQNAFDTNHHIWPLRKLTHTVILKLELPPRLPIGRFH